MNKELEENLEFGVVTTEDNKYKIYTRPGITIAEIAFCTMAAIRIMIKEGFLDNKKSFDDLVEKYYNDPNYEPIKDEEVTEEATEEVTEEVTNEQDRSENTES